MNPSTPPPSTTPTTPTTPTNPTGATGATTAPGLAIMLRNGAICELRDGWLFIAGTAVPLASVASAAMVADTSVPVPPGMPPAPALSLRMADGGQYFLTPAEPVDATKLLVAIHAARPELAMGGQPGYAPQPTYAPGPGYAPAPQPYGAPHPSGLSDTDRNLAGLAHLSVLFAPVILPLIFWLMLRQSHPYASKQSKQAFWFHLAIGVITFVVFGSLYAVFLAAVFSNAATLNPAADPTSIPGFPVAGFVALGIMYLVLFIVGIFNLVFSVIGAVKSFQGKPFHYPLLGWL